MNVNRPLAAMSVVSAAIMLYACGGGGGGGNVPTFPVPEPAPAPPAQAKATPITVLSSRPDTVSDGSSLVSVAIPEGVDPQKLRVSANGTDITSQFKASGSSLIGLATGLRIGGNKIAVTTDGTQTGEVNVGNFSRSGPIISGPQQKPWLCETEKFKLTDGSFLGASTDEFCNAPTKVTYIYKPIGGAAFKPLASTTSLPADVDKTTTSDGNTVNYILRVETGTVNRAIYQFAVLFDPTKDPAPTPVASFNGWNKRLVYVFGGSAASGYHQGDLESSSPTNILEETEKLSRGFAVVTSTLNIFGVMANDVVSAETASMVKEIFIKQFGPPKYTIGTGGSGGSMQVHLVGNNYPGLLDGIQPGASFPDNHSLIPYTIDCAVLTRAISSSGLSLTAEQKKAISGFNTWGTCDGPFGAWTNNFAPQWLEAKRSSIPLFPWKDGFLDINNCSMALPSEWLYDAVSNPTGIRCDLYQAIKNQVGIDPATNQPARAYDNIGVQYGLKAFKAGVITAEQFVVLNESAGGYDNDGNPTVTRTIASPVALKNLYSYGRINNAQNLGAIPILDVRYDPGTGPDVHDATRSLSMRARLIKANGTAGNQVIIRTNGSAPPPGAGDVPLGTDAFMKLDKWIANIKADSKEYAKPVDKVIANKPVDLADACQDASGAMIIEPADINNAGRCGTVMPYYGGDPRVAAGGPLEGDVLKCELKPLQPSEYPGMSAMQMTRLQAAFPSGVCDFSRPSVGNQGLIGAWLTYPEAGKAESLDRAR